MKDEAYGLEYVTFEQTFWYAEDTSELVKELCRFQVSSFRIDSTLSSSCLFPCHDPDILVAEEARNPRPKLVSCRAGEFVWDIL